MISRNMCTNLGKFARIPRQLREYVLAYAQIGETDARIQASAVHDHKGVN